MPHATRRAKAIAHCTLHTAHCTLHIAHCTLKRRGGVAAIAPQCSAPQGDPSLHIAHCTLNIEKAPETKKIPLASSKPRGLKKTVRAALLSRALERSIIAAGGLNGRVRDGNGCHTPARGTNQNCQMDGRYSNVQCAVCNVQCAMQDRPAARYIEAR